VCVSSARTDLCRGPVVPTNRLVRRGSTATEAACLDKVVIGRVLRNRFKHQQQDEWKEQEKRQYSVPPGEIV
ncbi:MAG: hypothetical protein AB2805_12480, partial [Candidatus Thiodiazotropha sp.]